MFNDLLRIKEFNLKSNQFIFNEFIFIERISSCFIHYHMIH